ncbi:MAG: CsbD family protein [Gammaproteobacteria bacterium]|nr:CsbD family protein [Gammaproteobacteria bacterium]
MDKDRVKGKGKQTGGSLKEGAGKATGDRKLENEGKADKGKGKVQEGFGRAKDKLRGK